MKILLTHVAEGAVPELEVESESVGAVRDLRGLSGTLEAVLGAVVDGIRKRVGPVDGAVRGTDGGLSHEALSS